MNDPKRRERLRKAILLAARITNPEQPTIAGLADVLGVSDKHIYACIDRGEFPAARAKQIHELTNGRASKKLLNPRIFG